MKLQPGRRYPLGATFDGAGTNFSLFSELAEKVELCLFDDAGKETRVDLPEVTGFTWHGYAPGIAPGQRYGFRVHGPYNPAEGKRCNRYKLLLDPYARAIEGHPQWNEALYGYHFNDQDGAPNGVDSAPFMPRSVVVNPWFDWSDDRPPKWAWNDTIVYEAHVKGLTKRHPGIPENLRGTYAGLASPPVIQYFKSLGITAVELLPIHQFVHSQHVVDRGLRNYWGYDSIGFFAPHDEYAAYGQRGDQVREFKWMVKTLHQAGIEVILDVVFNHTCEGNHLGPTLSFKGIDNLAYYRTTQDRRYYMDYTGTGNSLNMRHPQVLQMIMDSLRYWIQDMHVDGFRFDLAATLARELHDVDRLSAFFDLIQQDPVVSQVKLIAEPWDVGEGGYQVGNFPPLWSEWNGKYRDTVRDYWRGQNATLGEFAYRLTGSADLYASTGRRPFASVNFITAHDGFTLKDLVSYNEKHNEANGEENRDGANDNRSWNCGAEGPTNDDKVNALRARQQRNFLTTLLLSQGVPMISGGDEIGRSQKGNNNGYCQDNELSWFDWENFDESLLNFTRNLIALRRKHRIFARRKWFQGRPLHGTGVKDIAWFTPQAKEMSEEDWKAGFAKSLGVFLNGDAIASTDMYGDRVTDDSFYFVFNAHHEPMQFTLPDGSFAQNWLKLIDTNESPRRRDRRKGQQEFPAGGKIDVPPR
ncbi:MAG: glycogen debranching protein GlgX, partial [Deltaproteobacteria bacterium]